MGERQPVRITITLEGELDPTTVKAEAFGAVLASRPEDDDADRREMTEKAAAHLAGSLRASAQVLVMAADVGSLMEEWLPSFEARQDGGFSVMVDAPGLGPEDGGQYLAGWSE
jgi:hypothetical protein